MDVGIGLPNAVKGVDRDGIVEWARRAEAAGFSTLGTIDRIAYPTYESLIALAAAAAVTERIRLTTDVLLAPLRTNTALLAKQALSVDHLAGGGRLVLGVAVGGREDDYDVSGAAFNRRGRTFDAQLEALERHFAEAAVGPQAGVQLLVGGSNDKAYTRTARYASGWTMGGGSPDMLREAIPKVHEAWEAAGREGRPRIVALCYYGLGPDGAQHARTALGDYYAFLGEYVDQIVGGAATDEDTVRAYVQGFADAGADELICFPTSPDPEQVDLLAAAAL